MQGKQISSESYSHRIQKVIKCWIQDHFHDFQNNSSLMNTMKIFLKNKLIHSSSATQKWVKNVSSLLDNNQVNCMALS